MGVTVTKEYKKGTEQFVVTTLTPNKPIQNIYALVADDPTAAPTSPTKSILIKNVTHDETEMMPTGKQFATADIIRHDDDTTDVVIPPVEYNLDGENSITEEDIPPEYDDEECTNRGTLLANIAEEKSLKIQAKMYKGILNRTTQIGLNILFTGKLEAHNSSFNFGNDHIEVAEKVYGEAGFDVMEFVSDKLFDRNFSKIIISAADIKGFKSSLQECTANDCKTKGFVKYTEKQEPIVEVGYMLFGYHEDTMTPIYAVSASVKEMVRDETTGKLKKETIQLFPKGSMAFVGGKPIKHKFGALQIKKNNVSAPRKMRFRQWQETDENTQLVSERMQTCLTPFVASFEDVLIVTDLS